MAEGTLKLKLRQLGRELPPEVRDAPSWLNVFKVGWHYTYGALRERPGQIMLTAFLVLMAWGTHGQLELLGFVWEDWRMYAWPNWHYAVAGSSRRPTLLSFVRWDYELISFWGGMLLVVGIPVTIIKLVWRQSLADYGLGLPARGKRRLAVQTVLVLIPVFMPFFYFGAHDPGMKVVYPFFRGSFSSAGEFCLYELTYLPFFIAIEFVFRGFLLFGLAGVRDMHLSGAEAGEPGPLFFGKHALLIQMLAYTAWHLGKPMAELWTTPVWGLLVGALALNCRSIWPVVAVHWGLNVWLDAVIVYGW
jgi:Type II CAAX prenyl endopeptidase Rce1-like